MIAKIRKAKKNDYSACLPLFEALYHGDIGPSFQQIFKEFVKGNNSTALIATCLDEIVGILAGSFHLDIDWEGRIAKVDALVVQRNYGRKGIGKNLMNRFLEESKKRNCRAIVCRVNRRNIAAQRFFEGLSFEKAYTYEFILDLQCKYA